MKIVEKINCTYALDLVGQDRKQQNYKMRKEIIKILQKKPDYQQKHSVNSRDASTHNNTHQFETPSSNSCILHCLESKDEIEFEALKNIIQTASSRQTSELLSKVRAVQRVSTSAQKLKQQQNKTKSKGKQQRHPKLTIITDNFSRPNQNRKTERGTSLQRQEKEEQKQRKQYQEFLQSQVQLLTQEMSALSQEKEALNKKITALKLENDKLRASLVQKDKEITDLQARGKEMSRQANSMQDQIQLLTVEHQLLKNQTKSKTTISHCMTICSPTLRLTVLPTTKAKIEGKSRDVQLQVLNLEKKYSTIIAQLKAQHEEELTKLRKTLFQNINYYRDLTKKGAPLPTHHQQLQQILTKKEPQTPQSIVTSAGWVVQQQQLQGEA